MDEPGTDLRQTRREVMGGIAGGGVAAVALNADIGLTSNRQQSADATVWSTDLGGAIREYVVTDTSVYVGTDRGQLHRLDRATGKQTASVSLPAGVAPGGLAASSKYVVAATSDDEFVVYEAGTLGGQAGPAYRSRLGDSVVGMSIHDGAVCIGTRSGLVLLDLDSTEFRWRRYTDEVAVELLAPPLVYDSRGILLTGDTSLLFVAPETGEIDLRVPFEAPNHINVLSRPPAAITEAGRYVAYSGSDAHGCCPSWATFVVDRETREFAYRKFARSERQQSGAVTEQGVAHQLGDSSVVFADFEGGEPYRTRSVPRFDGIASTADRTFLVDSSTDATTTLLAVENDGYGVAWTQSLDVPIERVQVAGEYLFGIDESEGEVFAFAQSGRGADLREYSGGDADGETAGTSERTASDTSTAGEVDEAQPTAAGQESVAGRTNTSKITVPILNVQLSILESVLVILGSLVTTIGGLIKILGRILPNN